ncbi:MAG: transcriptional regulator [Gammaproteobacteria bacterium]|nr:MAG: transcriptional regulator [Gammaproteobacteria bacterium]
MSIKPIKIEQDYRQAMTEVDKLWGAKDGTPKGGRLDVLLVLVDEHENKHHQIDAPDPVDAILFCMEQLGLQRSDLEPHIGQKYRVSKVLNHIIFTR